MSIELLKQHYEIQIEHLRQKAIEIDNKEISSESFHYSIQELQEKNSSNKAHEKSFETHSYNLMQKLMNFEIHLKKLLKDCNGIKIPKNQSKNTQSQVLICDLLFILHSKALEFKENFRLAQADLIDILEVLRLMQKNGELVNVLTLKLGKKQKGIVYANRILQDISMNARQAVKTLEGIGAGLQSATECINQEYEQLQVKIQKIVMCLEKMGSKIVLD